MTPEDFVIEAPDSCPECGSSQLALDTKRAELMCMKCFIVVADVLSIPGTETEVENDVRVRSSDEDRLLPQYRFGTKDSAGRPVERDLLWKYRRVARAYNLRPHERTMLSMETRIRRLGAINEIPHGIVERAVNIYRRCKDGGVFKKPSLDEWATALILTACREVGYVVTVGSLVDDNIDMRKVLDYHHKMTRSLGLRARLPDTPAYVIYFAGRLGISPDNPITKHALYLSRFITDANAAPHCVAAASIYVAVRDTSLRVSQRTVCAVASISEISLRNWADRLGGYASKDTSPPALDKDGIVETLDDKKPNL